MSMLGTRRATLTDKELTCCMNYHDTGTKDAEHTLAKWFANVLSEEVVELRMQTGYFRLGAAKALASALLRAAQFNLKTHFVIGSNEGDTLYSEVSKLFIKLGIPRDGAKLAVVQFSNALFHPKVYHITRDDGSQAAFVGSANFTVAAITGGNVEAAISLDTRQGDDIEVLGKIAKAVDKWVVGPHLEGVWRLSSQEDIDKLLEKGVLSKEHLPKKSSSQTAANKLGGESVAKRQKLVVLPPWPDDEQDEVGEEDVDSPQEETQQGPIAPKNPELPDLQVQETVSDLELSVETRKGFPDYIKFALGADAPTSGWMALSGVKLNDPYVGLIMKLNKDSARHFSGGSGTANVSIPVDVAGTFRFGILKPSGRPRAEFSLKIRYHSQTLNVEQLCETNVMAYGFLPKDTGHGDLRMVVPAAVKQVAAEIASNGLAMPKAGDLFLLEWPNQCFDYFRMTFLEENSPEHILVTQAYQEAAQANRIIGSSCGLKKGLSPEW